MDRWIPAASVKAIRERWGLSPARAAFIAGGFSVDVWRADEVKGAPLFRFRSFCLAVGEDPALYFNGPPDLPTLDAAERDRVTDRAEAQIHALKAAALSRRAGPAPKSPPTGRSKRGR